jgi:enoyl-CoA hydratase/carnithine racemase
MATDYPIAMADTKFQLPGVSIGVPCTSPSVQVSRRVPPALVHRMLLTCEHVRADQLFGAVDVVPVPEHAESTDTAKAAFEKRIKEVVERLVSVPSQPQALGKSAYWAQLEMASWRATRMAGELMQTHTANEDGKEGIAAFLEKRSPNWKT